MFDFKNNDYEFREKGKDFWGNKRYEIIEKPKTRAGCLLGVVIIVILATIFGSKDESNSQQSIEQIDRFEQTEIQIEQPDEENKNEDSDESYIEQDDKTNDQNSDHESWLTDNSGNDSWKKPDEDRNLIINDDILTESETENNLQYKTDEQKVLELYDQYSMFERKKRKAISDISSSLNISKSEVKRILKDAGRL